MPETSITYTPCEIIRKTLDRYDPEHGGVLIGTSALHWELGSRGIDTSTIPLRDVDLLVPVDGLNAIYSLAQEVVEPERIRNKEFGLRVAASPEEKGSGFADLDVVTGSDSYENAIFALGDERIYYCSDLLDGHIASYSGISYTSLMFTLWWKTVTGRSSDNWTVQRTILLLHENNALQGGEVNLLLNAANGWLNGRDYLQDQLCEQPL